MRKFSRGNKKEFVFFTIVVGLIITVFIVGLNIVLAIEKKEYGVTSGNYTFDPEYNLIEIEDDGTISKKWDQNYYLHIEDKETALGKTAVYYEKNRKRLNIYGDSFEVLEGGDVLKYIQENEIADLKKDRLIKLSDRKYIIVGNYIKNENRSIDTVGFLMVILDQNGNTMLVNDELNEKTIKPLKLQTEDFTFDVANEKLIYDSQEIDLKKVIGSTNKYIEIRPTKKNNSNGNENQYADGSNEDGENRNNNNNNNNDQYKTDDQYSDYDELVFKAIQTMNDGIYNRNKQQASQSTQQQITQTQQTTTQQQTTQTQVSQQSRITYSKNITLRSITPGSTYMDVEYSVIDPENRYQTVYLDIQGNVQKIISLDKTQNHYTLTGLAPDTDYTVTLGCKEIMEDSTIEEKIEDTMLVKTAKVKETLTVTKVARGKIYFTFKMDSNYAYESGKIALYVDGDKVSTLDINISEAASSDGWKSNFRYDYGNEITLKLENTSVSGSIVSTGLQTKVKFY